MQLKYEKKLRPLLANIGLAAMLAFAVSIAAGQEIGPAYDEPEDQSESTATPTPTPTPTATPTPAPTPNTDAADVVTHKKIDSGDPSAKPKKERRGSLIPIPIPIKTPTFGSGMVLGLGYVFQLQKNDKVSPPSVIGFVGAFTNNGTHGGAFGGRLYFSENKYQSAFAFGKGDAVYQYYGIGRIPGKPAYSTEIHQSGQIFFAEFLRNFWKSIFIGGRYQYRKLTVHLGDKVTTGGFQIPAIDLVSTTAAIGFRVERDRRDSTFYPTKGSLFSIKGDFFGKAIGSNRTYQTYGAEYNGYYALGKNQVLAYRGSVCSVSEKAPFYDVCFYGSNSDLRGYTGGEFQNRRMFATQVEYRRELKWRLGLVGFAGFGGVAPHWSDFHWNELLPAAGAGLRFKIDKKNHINYRIDLGFGRGGHTLSMSVTEAF